MDDDNWPESADDGKRPAEPHPGYACVTAAAFLASAAFVVGCVGWLAVELWRILWPI
jgi:hypothetical protein